MTSSLLRDAFGHHVWATLRLLDACERLTPDQLQTTVPGTYGSILDTMRHLVGDDSWSLFVVTGNRSYVIDAEAMPLPGLRATIERNGAAWVQFLGKDPDPDAVIHEVDESDGFKRDAATGIMLAHAVHHGTDHRSQVCTALSALGTEPPHIDVLSFGVETGRSVEYPPTS